MAATDKEIVLITGGNAGLGFEIAKKLLKDHPDRFHILIGARTPSKGESAVKDLHSQGLRDCEPLEIDVTSNDSIAKAAKQVEQKFGRLDVLNANVYCQQHILFTPTDFSIRPASHQTRTTSTRFPFPT